MKLKAAGKISQWVHIEMKKIVNYKFKISYKLIVNIRIL